ncbi:MAG: ADP-forming succinate--CoA ligase subunit beta [Candidatus Nanoarchaeia archaeon]|nr:ADP-forming succinate--CoA ligase subunit beta [Candidatus Nanoarchaeia archaeon]
MKLKEYQGKELFRKYGIAVPEGKVITGVQEEPSKIAKAQTLSGKRGKSGLIAPATRENIEMMLKHCSEVLVEERLAIEKEYYLALTIDKEEKEIIILFSEEGGIEVESVKNILKLPYKRLNEFPDKKFAEIIESMHRLMADYNALLVEINPLAFAGNRLIAADSKIILDDNVKHPEYKQALTSLEQEAENSGLSYVELDGSIAIIGNGAGLVMATLDVISHFGGKTANFLDLGGGASTEKMEKAMDIVLKKSPASLFINIFGGITRCDKIAEGLVNYKARNNVRIPIIVRMIGTNEDAAKQLLAKNGIEVYDSMEEGARKAVENADK